MLFVSCPLRELVPDDHILRRVGRVLDLSWLRDEVRDLYCEDNGRPGIDPEAAVRLMLAGYFQGIVQDRKLMREAQVNLAIRWFAGYQLNERLPDHSTLTRIRQRWGAERFKRIFQKTVEQCMKAGLVSGETVHVDATLIRADVSWESLTTHHAEQVIAENEPPDDKPDGGGGASKCGRPRSKEPRPKKFSTTDPDATMATSCRQYHLEPTYKQHTAADDKAGVIVDVEVTTGEASEGEQLPEQIERIESNTGTKVKTVTADSGYAHSANYAHCEECGTAAIIPPQSERRQASNIPARRFKYDAHHEVVRCPGGRTLRRSSRVENSWIYRAKSSDCRNCPLRARCVPRSASSRIIRIVDGYDALLRARRRWPERDEATRSIYRRHRWRVEGLHGEAKTQHGLRRAVRRGLWNVAVQAYLTAAVMNLKRLAALLWRLLAVLGPYERSYGAHRTTGTRARIKIENPLRSSGARPIAALER